MVKVDEAIIDELIAGNLHGEQYRRVLLSLDRDPDGWKDCALAFLQEQALTRELKALSTDDEIWTDERKSPTAWSDYPQPVTATEDVAPRSRLDLLSKITSIAALLLISFTIGWFGSDFLNPNSAKSTQAGVRQVGTSNPIPVVENQPPAQPRGGTLVERGNDPRRFVVDGMMPFESTPSILQELRRQGAIDFESSGGYVPMYDENDGNSIRLVPVQQYRVKKKIFSY